MAKRVIMRYSEAFRIQAVREYEAGATVYSLRQKYGIGGKQVTAQENMRHTYRDVHRKHQEAAP